MRTARVGFVLFAFGALMCGAVYENRSASDQQREQSGSYTSQKPNRPTAKRPAKSKSAKQLPKRQAHLPSARAMNPRGSADRSAPIARASFIQNSTTGRYRPVRPRSSVGAAPSGAAASLRSNVRHRSPNPAVIAGSSDLSKRSTGAIDGRQVPRRP